VPLIPFFTPLLPRNPVFVKGVKSEHLGKLMGIFTYESKMVAI
jgi:hypothetical protein